jgi:hypothetical protein
LLGNPLCFVFDVYCFVRSSLIMSDKKEETKVTPRMAAGELPPAKDWTEVNITTMSLPDAVKAFNAVSGKLCIGAMRMTNGKTDLLCMNNMQKLLWNQGFSLGTHYKQVPDNAGVWHATCLPLGNGK